MKCEEEIRNIYFGELGITDVSEIDLNAIAYYLGAHVRYKTLSGSEAMIIGYGDKSIISINKSSHPLRQRFSVGHELGHWMKHRGTLGKLCKKESILPNRSSIKNSVLGKEKIANEYASELIMPCYLIRSEIENEIVSFDLIQSIRTRYRASLTAATIKYINLSDYPVLVACYHYGKRSWFHRSKEVPKFIFPVKEFSINSPGIRKLRYKDADYLPNEVDANVWVEYRGAFYHEVTEVVWPISSNKIMAFIWWHNESQIADLYQ